MCEIEKGGGGGREREKGREGVCLCAKERDIFFTSLYREHVF